MRMLRARARSFLHRIKTGRLVFKWDLHGDLIHQRYLLAQTRSLLLTPKSRFRLGQALWLPLERPTQVHRGERMLTRREEWLLSLKGKESLFNEIYYYYYYSFLIVTLGEKKCCFFWLGYMFYYL